MRKDPILGDADAPARAQRPRVAAGISVASGIALLTMLTGYADDSPPAHDRIVCTGGGGTREIVTRRADGQSAECRVDYTKDGRTSTLWSAHNDPQYCTRNAQELRQKLSAAGFSCSGTDSAARAQNLLPGGFLVRPAQQEDLQLVRALCPSAEWDRPRFTCDRNRWAPWATKAESAAIPRERRDAYESFVSGKGFIAMPTDGLVVFPDLSSHLLLDGFNQDTAQSALWLIDPVNKTVDIIWVVKDTTLYLGPDSTLLRNNNLNADSFKIGTGWRSASSGNN